MVRVATSYRVPTSNGTSYRTSVKYTRTTDEMATSYRTNFVRCHRTASYDRTTACGDFVVPLR